MINKELNKTPFNWVGNKYKFLEEINKVVNGKQYEFIYDLFMGSGNILLNISATSKLYMGNDKIKLLPNIYNELSKNDYIFSLEDIEYALNKFERFSTKESYYTFRDYWNNKYLNDVFDRDFIIETILLLKMCSNSMVRFNPKEGYFNQGFRGLGKKKEFFTDTMKNLCISELNRLSKTLKTNTYKFTNLNFKDIETKENGLYILDPPYILRKDMYDTDWDLECENKLFKLMETTNNDFVYFNYIERDGIMNEKLIDFINENRLRVIDINNKSLAGQGRSENITSVREVIVTNVHM